MLFPYRLNWRAFGPIITAFALAVVIIMSNANVASAQASATCNGVPISGTQEQVDLLMAACTAPDVPAPAGATPVTAGKCRVNHDANLRSAGVMDDNIVGGAKVGDKLAVLGHSADAKWTSTDKGWIWAAYCTNVPHTIETPPQSCEGYLRADDFKMDYGYDRNGVRYDKTIISTLPVDSAGNIDFCYPYRTVQDGANSSIINDLLPLPENRTNPPAQTDFTLLEDDWGDKEFAYYSGYAGCLVYDPDKSGPKGYEPVLDVEGKPVCGTEEGVQYFRVAPYVGAWMAWIWDGEGLWGFRLDWRPWVRE